MGSESDGEDYVYFGKPLEDAAAPVRGFYKAPQDPTKTRALPVWEQEVTDEEGRKRFHGAFTGGFSAGFYNSVGSKEGFAPASFKTSRSDRTSFAKQSIEDFMDEDELEERKQSSLTTKGDYDTFATGAAEKARRDAERNSESRQSLIPGPIIEELIQPVSESIGVKLLQKMGWRQGKGLGEQSQAQSQGSRWGQESNVLAENVPLFLLKPKSDLHGLGYDPFKNAEEFRKAKSSEKSKRASVKRNHGVAFGVGVLEETDQFGEVNDYVAEAGVKRNEEFDFEIRSEESDEGDHVHKGSHRSRGKLQRLGFREPKRLGTATSSYTSRSFIPGFRLSSTTVQPRVYPPHQVPRNFVPKHQSQRSDRNVLAPPGAPSSKKPENPELLKAINTLALYVARNGPTFEALARERHARDTRFAFLFGGEGVEYYKWKVLDEKMKSAKPGTNPAQRSQPLTAAERGKMLGEEELPKGSHEKPSTVPQEESKWKIPSRAVTSRPYLLDIAESDRKMLQDVLKSNFVRGSTQDLITNEPQKGGLRAPAPRPVEVPEEETSQIGNTPSSTRKDDEQGSSVAPVRSVEEWRPSPLLCKRFDIKDPFAGVKWSGDSGPKIQMYQINLPQTLGQPAPEDVAAPPRKVEEEEEEGGSAEEYVERPIDLFKAIFEASDSGESENEDEEKGDTGIDEKRTTEVEKPSKNRQAGRDSVHPVRESRWDKDPQKSIRENPEHDHEGRHRWEKNPKRDETHPEPSHKGEHRWEDESKAVEERREPKKAWRNGGDAAGGKSSDVCGSDKKGGACDIEVPSGGGAAEVPHGLSTSELNRLLKVLEDDKKSDRKKKKKGKKEKKKSHKEKKGKHKKKKSKKSTDRRREVLNDSSSSSD